MYSMTKSFGKHSAWFYRWRYFEWLYVSQTQNTLLLCYQMIKAYVPWAWCLPCTNLMLEGAYETGWGDRKRKTVAFCHATFHLHLQFPMEDVLWIFYIVCSDTPHKIHLVSWQKCTPGTRCCPALAPQERLLSSKDLTSHALLKSLVKDGHG